MEIQRVFDSPDQHLMAFAGDNAILLDMDRKAYQRSIFLDRRASPRSAKELVVSVAQLQSAMERAAPPAPRLGYIFHIAHCGSTLLARALDIENASLVLREPPPLRQLAVDYVHAGGASAGWTQRLNLVNAMLDRRYAQEAPVIVKANVPVNFILHPLMRLAPEQPAVLLYFSLENYLLAILRDEQRRTWVDRVSKELQSAITARAGPPSGGIAIAAARLWLAQMLIYADALKQFPNATSLDAEEFFNRPGVTLASAFAHFGAPQSDAVVNAIAASDLFSTYSKRPTVAFDNARRLEMQSGLRAELGPALEEARQWVRAQPAAQTLPERLEKPLSGEGCTLIGNAATR